MQQNLNLFSKNMPVVLRTSDVLVGLLLITSNFGAVDSR
jgi:hypothetical protein